MKFAKFMVITTISISAVKNWFIMFRKGEFELNDKWRNSSQGYAGTIGGKNII